MFLTTHLHIQADSHMHTHSHVHTHTHTHTPQRVFLLCLMSLTRTQSLTADTEAHTISSLGFSCTGLVFTVRQLVFKLRQKRSCPLSDIFLFVTSHSSDIPKREIKKSLTIIAILSTLCRFGSRIRSGAPHAK